MKNIVGLSLQQLYSQNCRSELGLKFGCLWQVCHAFTFFINQKKKNPNFFHSERLHIAIGMLDMQILAPHPYCCPTATKQCTSRLNLSKPILSPPKDK